MIKILTLQDTKRVLTVRDGIAAVETAYREKATGDAVVFPMVFHEFHPGVADMDIKSGDIKGLNAFGLKMVAWYGENPAKGLPALTGVVMMFDNRTGMPIGLINGEYMTGIRTGAAGAIGIKYLARKNSEKMLMVGAGTQAAFQVKAALAVLPELKKIRVYDPVNREFAESFITKLMDTVGKEYPLVEWEAVDELSEAVADSDVIVTATPSKTPMILKAWVKPGTHFSCMGSDMSGKQEIHQDILADAHLVADDIGQSVAVGEFETGIKKGVIKQSDIQAEIGEIIAGMKPGRASEEEITVFDSTGIGLQDISVGALALRKAEELGIGVTVDF